MYMIVLVFLYPFVIDIFLLLSGFPGGSDVKASAYNVGDPGSIPGLGRSPGDGNGNPLQYSCLENPRNGGAWSATVPGVTNSQTQPSHFTSYYSKDFPDGSAVRYLLAMKETQEIGF